MLTEGEVQKAYEFFLGRLPENPGVMQAYLRLPDTAALCRTMVESAEFQARWARMVGHPRAGGENLLPAPQSGREAMLTEGEVQKAYEYFLGRLPENPGVMQAYLRLPDTAALCRTMVESAEFQARWARMVGHPLPVALAPPTGKPPALLTDAEVIASFPPRTDRGQPGFVTDFLGGRTRVGFVNILTHYDGQVWPPPTEATYLFPMSEWVGTLRSVLEADPSRTFVAMELGAGWAPWCVASVYACRRRGLTRVRTTAVEASAGHVAFARQNFADNGVPESAYALLEGAVMPTDGWVEFPEVEHPDADYGAAVGDVPLVGRPQSDKVVRVRAYSIATLLTPEQRVDLMHIDIQGGEAEAVRAARHELKAKVRRMVIGTHSRGIEHQLLADLSADGWELEHDEACGYALNNGKFSLHSDGCQVWRNPAV